MTRYFQTSLARRPVVAAGKSFNFELVGQWGGSWFGVLAVDDESAANSLADSCTGENTGTLEEITLEQYEAKKKALSLTGNDSHALRKPPAESPLNHVVADRAGSLLPASKPNGGPNSTELITRLTVMSTDRSPPREPILEASGAKRGF